MSPWTSAKAGGTVFCCRVVDFAADGTVRTSIEKPATPPSNYAINGLYFLDGSASGRAAEVHPSDRGELEITSLL